MRKNKFDEIVDWCCRVLDDNTHVSNEERDAFITYLKVNKDTIGDDEADKVIEILSNPLEWGDKKISKIKAFI